MTHRFSRSVRRALVASALLACTSLAAAQSQAPPTLQVDYTHDTDWVANDTAEPRVVISFPVHVPSARWMRLHFENVTLAGDLLAGDGAILRITSHEDGHVQEMNANHVRQWQKSSAFFNGNTVQVEVLAQPGTGPSRIVMQEVDAGLSYLDESQCGALDDRVPSNDARCARILPIGCTGWLIDDCQNCFLTAGHCTGAIDVIQFQVPQSNPDGSLNQPSPDDQYALDPSSLQTNGGQGVGNDWGYFGCFPNTNTGLTPFQAQGSAFSVQPPPPVGTANIRITGYGVDTGSSNQTQQTHVGPLVTNSGTTVQYQTDTTGGNSGSPVIWDQMDVAVGIHTHGGCLTDGTGQNSGTGSVHLDLQGALGEPTGICSAGVVPADLPILLSDAAGTPLMANVFGNPVAGMTKLHYRYGAGAFTEIVMNSLGGTLFGATLPPAPCNGSPEYFFSTVDAGCGMVTTPSNAPADVFTALVGVGAVSFADDFESDTGWTTLNIGATTGDWERAVPVNDPGWAYDPESDSDGSGQCYLTQNTLGNSDVDNGSQQLTSPTFDASAGGVLITYDYYLRLSLQDGSDRMLVEANNNAGSGWRQVALHDTDGGLSWRTNTVSSTDLAAAGIAPSANTQMRFTVNDADTQSFVEAGIDAFLVQSVSCGGGGVGTNYCVSSSATISASGSASVSTNNLVLSASGVPANENGIFYYGTDQTLVPFGLGAQCVDGAVLARLAVENSGAAGVLTHALDNTNPPTPFGQITAGSTWNFQAWFRVGGQFDLSDGLEISFIP